MEDSNNCETFKNFYYHIFKRINYEFLQETGKEIKPYKEYEPDLLLTFCNKYNDEPELIHQLTKLLSGLIILQTLPNANHRTAFRFIDLYLGFIGRVKLKTYTEEKYLYDEFYKISKPIIDLDINHHALFNDKYMDVHHSMGIEKHFKCSKELIEKIIKTQSGITEAVPFQRFITSLYQSGSSSNQTGSF